MFRGRKIIIVVVLLVMVALQLAVMVPAADAASVRVWAKSVVEDKSVTLVGAHLAANTRYNVSLGKYGKPLTAVVVGYAVTDASGSFTKAYVIPGKLADIAKISISLSSAKGDTASNWFINATASSNTGGDSATAVTFTITSLKRNSWVKIKTSSLPADVPFEVRMGKEGTKGVKGIVVGELVSDNGGTVKATFEIPDALSGKAKIDMRIENKQLGMSYYVTFENK